MLKNTAGQKIGAQMVDLDGVAFTGSVTVYVCGDAGTQAAGSVGSGACTHEGNGYHTYAPSQAETNYDLIAFSFTGTNAVPVTVQVSTRAATGIAAVKTKTDNLPSDTNTLLTSTGIKVASIANGAIAAATFAAGALDAVWSVASRTLTAISDSAGITTLLSRIGSALTINSGKVTVGTNDDKNGYALATTPPTAAQIRTEMDANSTKLANLDAAIAALHDFDPASDTVAHVTLVDTTTTLTNALDVPIEAEIADAVRTELTPELAAVLAMETRMEEQVPTGPVVVLPAPASGQTIAWVMCYGPTGAIEAGATISIFLTKTTEDGAFDAAAAVLTSDEDGLAQGPIPRGAGHTFKARRGTNGKLYTFSGVDSDSLALPSLLGSP